MRPAGAAEDTARLDDDARPARRLPLDRHPTGCVADKRKGNVAGTGVSAGAARVDPPARPQPIMARARARAAPQSLPPTDFIPKSGIPHAVTVW